MNDKSTIDVMDAVLSLGVILRRIVAAVERQTEVHERILQCLDAIETQYRTEADNDAVC